MRRQAFDLFRRTPPTLAELAEDTAEARWLRAIALKNGLDPERTPPEDILLLKEDEKGNLLVGEELDKARRRLADEEAAARLAREQTTT